MSVTVRPTLERPADSLTVGLIAPGLAARRRLVASLRATGLEVTVDPKLGVRSRNEATRLVLDPEHGLGSTILEISGEALESPPSSTTAA